MPNALTILHKRDKTSTSSPGWLMWRLTNLWQRRMQDSLDKYRITNFQFLVLRSIKILGAELDEVCQADIANFTNSNPMMVSTVIRSLISKGLVERTMSTYDSRAYKVSLTEVGEKLSEESARTASKMNKDFFGVIGESQGELINFLKLLIESNDYKVR
ncbi:MAG: hypothetical protein OHK0017_00730 [Patescibacteria group bacterium]